MVLLDGGPFLMGSESPEIIPGDGEDPVRKIVLSPFRVSRYPVTNAEFALFASATGYRTESERIGWSFVFRNHLPPDSPYSSANSTDWWLAVPRSDWRHPFGPHSSIHGLKSHPVTHVSWNDAQAYCAWAGCRLPYEAEWEFAARGGLEQKRYGWGDELAPDGQPRCNTFEGDFLHFDAGIDGFTAPAPVDAYFPNGYGLYNCNGNVWEWCQDFFDPVPFRDRVARNPHGPEEGSLRVMRGGSYLCHASYCWRYRNSARTGTPPDSSTTHIGFRVVLNVLSENQKVMPA